MFVTWEQQKTMLEANKILNFDVEIHTTQPFYSSLEFVRDNPGELVP